MQVGPAWGGPPAPGEELQPAPGDELRIVTVDTSAFPDVTATVALPVTARDRSDASADLSVSSAGGEVPVAVERLPADRQPVAILIDTADGTGDAMFAAQQGAAAELVRQLDPATPIVIGSSAGLAVFGPDTDREAGLAALGRLRLGGPREWPRSLATALDAVRTEHAPRATVVVMSTGPSSETDAAPSVLPERLAGDAVRVCWISLRSDAGPVGALKGIQPVMPATIDGLLARLDSIAAELAAQYRLKFRVDPRAIAAAITLVANGRTWTVETPLPLPSPAHIEQSASPTVLSATESPPDTTEAPSRLESIAAVLNRNPTLVIIGAVATLILGAALSLRSAEE